MMLWKGLLSLIKIIRMDAPAFGLDEQNANLSSKIVVSLEKVAEIFRVLLWEEAKLHGLSPIQIQILVFIHEHESSFARVSYLAKEFNLTKPTISDAVTSLVGKKMLTKTKNPDDTRSFHLVLTNKGEKAAKELGFFSNKLKGTVDKLPNKQKHDLWNSLFNILVSFEESSVISVQRMCFNCQFYQKNSENHYCNFLKKPLTNQEIRIDCPEHKPKSG